MRTLTSLLCILLLVPALATSSRAATPELEALGDLPLDKAHGEVTEALLDTSRDLVWVRDFQITSEGITSHALEVYSTSGEPVDRLDAGEGGFFRMIDIALDDAGRLWALDYGGRLTVFQEPLNVAETHLTAAKGAYPYYPGALAIDSGRRRVYVTGCAPLGITLSHGCLEVHSYTLREFDKLESFLETPPALGNERLASRIGLVAVVEDDGTVFYARLAAPQIFRLAPPEWKPQALSLGQWGFEASRYRADWLAAEKVTALVSSDDTVVVGIDRPEKSRSAAVFFSPAGELLGAIEPAPGRLVGRATDGSLLFARREDGRWVLKRYAIKK